MPSCRNGCGRLAIAGAALAGLVLAGCGRGRMLQPDQSATPAPALASMFHTADPLSAAQLLDGFYHAEDFGRWTGRKFSVMLAPPHSPDPTDPRLLLKLYVPDEQMKKLQPIKLSAVVNGVALEPELLTIPGVQTYTRSVPPAALTGGNVRVDFTLDKWMPPSPTDSRELGIVVTVVGLTTNGSAGL